MKSYLEIIKELEASGFKQTILTEDWMQGRAGFGGLVGGLLFLSAQDAVQDESRKVRNAQVTFVGPIVPDVPVTFEVEILRKGGSTTSVLCKGIQQGSVQAVMQASFSKDRESNHKAKPLEPIADYTAPLENQEVPFIKGLLPNFSQHFHMRWAEGGMPYSNDTESRKMGGWTTFRNEDKFFMGEAEFITLLDSFPPIALLSFNGFAPASTLNWTIQFVQDAPELKEKSIESDEFVKYQVKSLQGADGFSHAVARIWSKQGNLLAISSQTVALFG